MDKKSYAVAQQASYAGQQTSFAFPAQGGVSEVSLGFQPLGINILGSTIAIAAYFEPAVMLVEVSLKQDILHLSNIRWIRGTIADGKLVRMFPNLFQPGDANRMQAVLMYTPMRLGLMRNGDRQIFPIELSGEQWLHSHAVPFRSGGLAMVHSAVLTDKGLVTIETDEKAEQWAICDYRGANVQKQQVTPYRYGIAVRSNGEFVTVTDYRAKEHGLYVGDTKKVGVIGNGVVLLNDGEGGALVTRYGQGNPGPFNGVPGALIYVPPQFLK